MATVGEGEVERFSNGERKDKREREKGKKMRFLNDFLII